MKYYIADIHFGHEKIIEYENRPFRTVEEMDEEYIRRWNAKVKPGDDVYILGDFSFHKGEETNRILLRLNGKKFLIQGNHDNMYLCDKDFRHSLFMWERDYYISRDGGDHVILFHYPIQTWFNQHRDTLHFYGHVHSNSGTFHPMKYEIPNSYNVCIDVIGEPMTKDEILEFYRKKGKEE